MGILYLVATPIGNLEDMSPRAIRTLGEVNLIAAEDTRVTRKILTHFSIRTRLTSYFEHNKLTKQETILAALRQGNVALVSDAGMPAINDPGYELVKAALQEGHSISPIPGPSASLAALAISGLPTDTFVYLGYLPRKAPERRVFLRKVRDLQQTMILFETPHRLLSALRDLEGELGDREIAICREMTKLHEETWRGRIRGAINHFSNNAPRGEFTIVVAGQRLQGRSRWSDEQVLDAIQSGLTIGESPASLAKRIADESGWKRKEIYTQIMDEKRNEP